MLDKHALTNLNGVRAPIGINNLISPDHHPLLPFNKTTIIKKAKIKKIALYKILHLVCDSEGLMSVMLQLWKTESWQACGTEIVMEIGMQVSGAP
ncbi:hypothetical protein CCR75_004731 [Bremia lactucae]|uniref:Uncharacterized protein n=1 Tax=Bremia lactucae TaxID=4779 RepID=A0A976IKU9_BRELC|nr:hypothetical protein CCR75_004731 [Bremia lactucae]